MKPTLQPFFQKNAAARCAGFTLAEIMVALTIFLFVLGGVLFANLYGLSMFKMNSTKLNVTQWSRETIETISEQIHSCNSVQVGNITNGAFAGMLNGEKQQGSGLIIYPTTNAAIFLVYFVNGADQTFRRTDQSGRTAILAGSVTNTLAFTAQDLAGNVLTNNVNNQVIHISLSIYQPQRFLQDEDNYQLDTSVTRRVF